MDEDLVNPLFLYPQKDYKIPGGTVNLTRRAQALLYGIDRRLQLFPGVGPSSLVGIDFPAIGRTADMTTLKKPGKNTTTSSIAFTARADPFMDGVRLDGPQPRHPADKPFRYGLKDPKSQALRYILGTFFDQVPEKGSIYGVGVDDRRKNVYQRYTGGAIGPTGQGYRRPDGRFQGIRYEGESPRFMKAVDSPGDRLRKPLLDTALSIKNPIYAAAGPVLKRVVKNPYVQAYYNLEDIIQSITGKSPTRETLKAANEQIKKSVTAAPSLNFGPLLPF